MPDDRQQIHVVQSGDNLYKIALEHHTTPEAILRLNRLTSVNLTVGQRLQIPIYTEAVVTSNVVNVRRTAGTGSPIVAQLERGTKIPVTGGDSEWVKVRLYNGKAGWISREFINLTPHGTEKPFTEILGFYTEEEGPTLPSSYKDFTTNWPEISDIAMFHFRIDRNDTTKIEKFYQFSDDYIKRVIEFGHRHNIKMTPVIHNLLYTRGNQETNKVVLRGMLQTQETRAAFITNVVTLVEQYGFDGAHIDFEDIYIEDAPKLSAFYRELGAALKSKGYYYVVSTPSRNSDRPTNPFSAAFDYSVIGSVVDEFSAMLYNEHGWPGSGPGPVVSIGWMEQVLRYAMTKMPARKITAAVSVFGFDFNLTKKRNTYVTYGMAMNLAKKYNKQVIFDQATKTPMFRYKDEEGNDHEVWFENADSIRAKIQLANRLGVRGLALWRLGMEDPNIWTMLRDEFVVLKSMV
ncbi:MAG: glycosyl hydrolase family 18 protein [Tumebacillaceae bacterium]